MPNLTACASVAFLVVLMINIAPADPVQRGSSWVRQPVEIIESFTNMRAVTSRRAVTLKRFKSPLEWVMWSDLWGDSNLRMFGLQRNDNWYFMFGKRNKTIILKRGTPPHGSALPSDGRLFKFMKFPTSMASVLQHSPSGLYVTSDASRRLTLDRGKVAINLSIVPVMEG